MAKKIIMLVAITIMAITLVACKKEIPYNAMIYDDAGEWMHEEFLLDNLTQGVLHGDVYLDDDSYPKNINHLLRSEEEFNAVFSQFSSEIDFDDSMVCIFIFTCNYTRPYEISKISMNNQVLKIEVKSIKPKGVVGDAVPSWQRCLVVVMDKLEITSLEFVEK